MKSRIQSFFPFALFCCLVLVGCGGPAYPPRPQSKVQTTDLLSSGPEATSDKGSGSVAIFRDVPKVEVAIPPWQVWDEGLVFNRDTGRGDQLVHEGDFLGAISVFKKAEETADSQADRTQAAIRRLGTSLRFGDAESVLRDAAESLKARGKTFTDAHPELALVVSFAYLKEGNIDQAFAWFKLARTRGSDLPRVRQVSEDYLVKLTQSLNAEQFAAAKGKWGGDEIISPYLKEEEDRRRSGGQVVALALGSYFVAAASNSVVTEEQRGESFRIAGEDSGAFGVILPLSGQYSEHAQQIRNGIDLALESLPEAERPAVFYADSMGDQAVAQKEFERLVREQRISVLIGPLLSKCAESIAPVAEKLGVPVVTFTKRPDITKLGNTLFRLGATAEDQGNQLAQYVSRELKFKSVGVLYSDQADAELVSAFDKAVAQNGLVVVGEKRYELADKQSLQNAISSLSNTGAEAIFIPDPLQQGITAITMLGQSALRGSVILGPALWDDTASLRSFSQSIQGATYVTPFFVKSPLPHVVSFVEAYRNRFGDEPDLLAAQAYDVARLLIERKKISSSNNLLAQLNRGGVFNGVTGKLTIESDREIVREMSVVRIFDGQPQEVMNAGVTREKRFDGQT